MKCVMCGAPVEGTFCSLECYKDYHYFLKRPSCPVDKRIDIKISKTYYETIIHGEKWISF